MSKEIIPAARIAQSIYLLRGQKIMLDFDLAALYEVAAKVLNQAVKRNRERFPADFVFQLTAQEFVNLKSQFVTSSQQIIDSQRIPSNWSQIVTSSSKHRGAAIDAILEAIRQLMAPPTKPRREIGFHVREKAVRYRTRKRR